jgi:intracellular multiplication protein IcmL
MSTPAPKDGKKPSAGRPLGALEAVVTRNLYYKDGYRNLVRIALFQALAICILIAALAITIAVSRPEDRFFATTSDGRLIRMIALNEPNMNDAAIVSWAARAASDVMTFGFHDYQKRMQESSTHFTRRGWQSFTDALGRSRLMENVQKSQQVVTAAPKGAPVVVQQGLVDGIYRWVVELPLIVTYQSGTAQTSSTLEIQLVIVRVSTLDNPSGVGIQQWIAR